MKWVLLSVSSGKEVWFEEAKSNYETKISRMISFYTDEIKSVKLERDDSVKKKKKESELILSRIEKDDYVVLFDEKGKSFTSIQWAHYLENEISYSQKRMVFIIGGAFGVEEELKKRAQLVVSLSSFVMNHRVAYLVVLEQLYRSLMIIKKIPYHNV